MRLGSLPDRLPPILELGLREWRADAQSGFSGLADVLEFLASLPTFAKTHRNIENSPSIALGLLVSYEDCSSVNVRLSCLKSLPHRY